MRKRHASSQPEINAVLATRDPWPTQLPGVVGICVCVPGREKSPWLKVILPEPAPEIERQIPRGCRAVTQIF